MKTFSSWMRVPALALCVALSMAVLAAGAQAQAQTQTQVQSPRVYRCGNVYTNQTEGLSNCKPLTGGHVTVIEGMRVQSPSPAAPNAAGAASATKIDSAEQRQRDTQAHAVLQAELQRAQQQQAELLREWNNGEPERRADEARQPAKYATRVAQLRASLSRIEADIAGLQRELARLSSAPSTGAKP